MLISDEEKEEERVSIEERWERRKGRKGGRTGLDIVMSYAVRMEILDPG